LIGKDEQWKWLDMLIAGIYNVISLVMEKVFNVPMKEYFASLQNKIVDYRQLLMKDETVSETVHTLMPMTTNSGKKGMWTIIAVMVGQVLVGCILAVIHKFSSKRVIMGSEIGVGILSESVDSYMFGNKSLYESIMSIVTGLGGLGKGQPSRPQGVRVDV
jgi:hypothetical protein